jgi:uncharacterized protein YceH (UPF0502 family)
VNEKLDGLMTRDEPLVVKLERQPGQKEARYAHLLSGAVTAASFPQREKSAGSESGDDRVATLQVEVAELRNELNAFRELFDEFRKQFD